MVATATKGESGFGCVDVHAHISDPDALTAMRSVGPNVVPELTKKGSEWWIEYPNGRSRTVELGLLDVDKRIRDMNSTRVQSQALASFTHFFLYDVEPSLGAELLSIQNDAFIEIARAHDDRFVAMGGLPMQDSEAAVREVKRLAASSHVAGVQICTNVNGLNLDDESLEPVWQALESHDLPVLVHPVGSNPIGKERLSRYHLVNLIGNPVETAIAIASVACSGIAERYPGLRFCFVHGGGFMPYQLGRWDHGWEIGKATRDRIDRPPSDYVKGFFFDTLTHDTKALRFLGTRLGWSQVVVGTDYPWSMGTGHPVDDVESADLPDHIMSRIMRENAVRFLRGTA